MDTALYTALQAAWTEARAHVDQVLAGQEPAADRLEQALAYLALMLEQNQSLNLSAIKDPQEAIYLHLLDFWTLLPLLDREAARQKSSSSGPAAPPPLTFMDLGTGAGFPGVPLKILRPQLDLYLVDALAKRLKFIERALTELAVDQPWQLLHARAEELGRKPLYRDKLAVVTARALANLPVLLEYALPLVRPGGVFVAMKANYEEELAQAGKAAEKLGAKLEDIQSFVLPGSEARRSFLIYRKLQPTPAKYPRSNAQIKKGPLS